MTATPPACTVSAFASVDAPETEWRRASERQARLARGRPYAEFEAEWLQRKPPEEILANYGSWPDARPLQPLMRP